MIKNYKQAVSYLESFINFGLFNRIDPKTGIGEEKLERIKVFLKKIGNPDLQFPSIIISGTSGKGSTSYLIANMLVYNGYKVGLTISPHLQKMNERIQVGENLFINSISDERFVSLLNSLLPQLEEMKNEKAGSLSFPEILFCMALAYFADCKVDIVICEVGLEGRFDFSNVLNPIGFALTNISLDHTKILGDTVEKIGQEATYKIKNLELKTKNEKSLIPFVITGVSQKSIIDLVYKRAKVSSSEVFLLGKDFSFKIIKEDKSGVGFVFSSFQDDNSHFFVSLTGAYQAENASLAIETVLNLKTFGFGINLEKIKKALANSFWSGRFEIIHLPIGNNNFEIVLDGAHNVAKMSAFLKSLKKLYLKNPKIFIIAFKKDKNIEKMLKEIIKIADNLIITQFEQAIDFGQKMSSEILSVRNLISSLNLRTKLNIIYEKKAGNAFKKALKLATKKQKLKPIIVTTGSLYLVGEIREMLNQLPV